MQSHLMRREQAEFRDLSESTQETKGFQMSHKRDESVENQK